MDTFSILLMATGTISFLIAWNHSCTKTINDGLAFILVALIFTTTIVGGLAGNGFIAPFILAVLSVLIGFLLFLFLLVTIPLTAVVAPIVALIFLINYFI